MLVYRQNQPILSFADIFIEHCEIGHFDNLNNLQKTFATHLPAMPSSSDTGINAKIVFSTGF